MSDDINLTTADMLEIAASGGNGVEYVNVPALMEKASAELRVVTAERDRLRDALKPFADESLWTGPQHGFVCIPVSACDRARKALGDTP